MTDYSALAFGSDYTEKQAAAGRNLTPEQRAAAAASLGIDLNVITRGINNPQSGFTDPRSSGQLLNAPAKPAVNTSEKDGSGTTTKNQPAQRNPQLTGFPSISPLAINDTKVVPSQVTEKLKSLITDISGPKAGSINVDIAGGAAGAVAALNPSALVGGLTGQLKGLLPDPSKLAGSISHLPAGVTSLTPASLSSLSNPVAGLSSQVSGLTSGLTSSVTSGISGALGSITDAQKAQAASDFAKAQATITEGLGKANDAASSALAKAQASLGLKDGSAALSNLRGGAGNIASNIFDKLKGFAPASITTKIPVNAISEVKVPVAATGVSTANDPVPNPIPPNVPLYQANSSQKKSIENMVSVLKDAVDAKESELLSKLQNIKTTPELNNWVSEKGLFALSIVQKVKNEINPLIEKGSGDSTFASDLLQYNKKLYDNGYPLDKAFNAKYDEIKLLGN